MIISLLIQNPLKYKYISNLWAEKCLVHGCMYVQTYRKDLHVLFLNHLTTVWDDGSSGAAGEPAPLQEVIRVATVSEQDVTQEE